MKRIESRDNKWIKRLNGLKIKKNRDKEGLFIAEGLRFIREIPKNWEVLAYAVSDALCRRKRPFPLRRKGRGALSDRCALCRRLRYGKPTGNSGGLQKAGLGCRCGACEKNALPPSGGRAE